MIDEPIKTPYERAKELAYDAGIETRNHTVALLMADFATSENAALQQQVAALTAALKHVKELGEKFTMPTLVDIAQNALAAGGKDAKTE